MKSSCENIVVEARIPILFSNNTCYFHAESQKQNGRNYHDGDMCKDSFHSNPSILYSLAHFTNGNNWCLPGDLHQFQVVGLYCRWHNRCLTLHHSSGVIIFLPAWTARIIDLSRCCTSQQTSIQLHCLGCLRFGLRRQSSRLLHILCFQTPRERLLGSKHP